ncbi:MAG: YitT family protein, partial [Clostridia bacterium]|nr:YitT family protein [Clostridia bacterium]
MISKSITIRKYLSMTVGTVLMTVGIYFFKIPNGFTTGGVSGISTVLAKVLPYVTPGGLILLFNLVLLSVGFFVLGRGTGIGTVWCSLVFSGLTRTLELVCPLKAPLTDQPFLELVIGILLSSFGTAVIFNSGASSGGTDVIALIMKKYTSLDVGKALLATDFLIALSTFPVFGLTTGLYSLLGLFAKAFLIDEVMENLNQCKSFLIITDDAGPLVDHIIGVMKHSATTFDAVGEYEG